MTHEQFSAGVPFAVFGLQYDFLVFNQRMDQVLCYVDGKIKDQSFLAGDSADGFTAYINVFGLKQPITVQFPYCELKA